MMPLMSFFDISEWCSLIFLISCDFVRWVGMLPPVGGEWACDQSSSRGRCARAGRSCENHGRRVADEPKAAPEKNRIAAYTASFNSLVARKATFLLALILIGSPVAGLRPLRAARVRTTRMPSPPMRMRSAFLRGLTI